MTIVTPASESSFQILHRHFRRRRLAWRGNELRDLWRQLVRRNLAEVIHRAENLRIRAACFLGRRLPGVGERQQIAVRDEERGAIDRAVLLRERDEFLVHRLIEHRVHEEVRAGSQRRLRDDELGRVHGELLAGRVRRIADRLDDRFLCREVVAFLVDEPDFQIVGIALELLRDQRISRLDGVRLDDRRIAEIELRPAHEREKGPRNRHARRGFRFPCKCPHVEIPERPADVHDTGDAAREPDLESLRQPRLVAPHFVCIRHDGVEIRRVRARVRIARLEEVHVRIDEPRHDPLATAVDDLRALGQLERDAGARELDLVAGDHERRHLLDGRGALALGMNQRDAIDDGDVGSGTFGRGRLRRKKNGQPQESCSHCIPRLVPGERLWQATSATATSA